MPPKISPPEGEPDRRTVSRPGTRLEHGLLTSWVLVPLPQRLEVCAELRDRVALDLIGPLGIDRLNIWRDGHSQIEGQIGHIERPPIETERRACRNSSPCGTPFLSMPSKSPSLRE